MAGNITLSVSTVSNGATSATVRVTMTYYGNGVSHNADASTISQKITLNGTTKTIGPHTFTTSTSAQTMGSADFSINKTHAAQSLTASGSMYTDVSLGTLTATASVSVSAKTSYSVSYNANGGSGAPSASTKWYGENLTLSTTKPTRSGYTFMGWGTSASDTSVDYASGGTYSSNSGTTLYAIWKKDITLSYDANTGSGAPSNETKTVYNATTSATFTIPSTVPTKQYYKFTGWKTGSTTYQPATQITISSNTTLTAQWVEDYISPQYGTVTVYRTNSAGTTNNGSGTYGKLTFTWTNGSLSGTTFNTTATAKYQEHGASSWTTITNGSSTANTFSAVFGGGNLAADKQYDILISLQDTGYDANEYSTYISTELFTIDVNADGTAVSFFEPAPDDDSGVFAPPMTETELNAFLDSLNRNFRGSVDWIVEEGTSGIWTYRKWDSGIAECWGTSTGTTTCNTSWGSSMQITPTLSASFPSGLFDATPCVIMSSKSAGYSSLIIFNTGTTTKDVVIFQLGRPTAIASIPFAVDIQAKGRWK